MASIGEFGAAVAEVDIDREPDTFSFYGHEFTLADQVGSMPFLRFAHAAASGLDSAEVEAQAAMYDLLRDVIVPEQWLAFQSVATEHKADGDELLEICKAVYQAMSGRPTRRPSDSSDGPLSIGESSREPSSSVASSRLGPVMSDPRVLELQTVRDAGRTVLGRVAAV